MTTCMHHDFFGYIPLYCQLIDGPDNYRLALGLRLALNLPFHPTYDSTLTL
jgi:hypothetical protein